jgi:predicted metal-dependent hydrolase
MVHEVHEPQLLEQVRGFSKQEVQHARAHEQYFDWMRARGYRIDRYLDLLAKYARWNERMNTARYNLASTAASEHLTAIIGVLFLTEPGLKTNMHPMMQQFLTWHSVEEIEHKAVAFDVLRKAGIGYFKRIFVYTLTLLEMFVWIHSAIYMLARQDGLSLLAMYRCKRRSRKYMKGISRRFFKYLFAYYRPSFHPSQDMAVMNLQSHLDNVGLSTP